MNIRDRIKDFRRVKAKLLRPNPYNWRRHPQKQHDALRGILAELGYVGALLVRELDDGTLEIIDGHLRAETTPETEVPVLVLDVTEAEAKLILATYDSIADMAEADPEPLERLLEEVQPKSEDVQAMLDDLASKAGIEPPDFEPVSIDDQDRLDTKAPLVCPNCGTLVPRPA